MKSIEDVKKFYQNAAMETNPKRDEIFLKKLLVAHETKMNTDSAAVEPNIRRTIMKNPITKFAAASVIIIAVALGLFEFSGTGTTSGVVWSQVMEKTEQIPAVVFDMTAEIDEPEGKLVLPARVYVAGDYGTRADTFMDGKLVAINYRLPRKNVAYEIKVDRKRYWRFDVSYDQAALARDPDDPRTWLKLILSEEHTKLGRTTIDGVVVEGIEGHRLEDSGEDTVMRLWVDVETNLPVRIEVEVKGMEGGRMKQQKFVMENFDWNAQLDESFFEPNIPDDYTLVEDPGASRDRQESSKAQPTSPQTLTEQEQAEQPKVKEAVRRLFNACTEQDWDTVSKYLPYVNMSQRTKDILAGLETIYIGEPAKAANGKNWLIPYEIKFKNGGTQKNTMGLKADENTGQFIVLGGF
jgi:outer membrane lipoprotein-sorting protein